MDLLFALRFPGFESEVERDAKLGRPMIDTMVLKSYGERPRFDPEGADRALAESLVVPPEVEDAREDIGEIDRELARRGEPWTLKVMLLLVVLIEFLGAVAVAEAMGFPPATRVLIALGITLIAIVGVGALVWLARRRQVDPITGEERRSSWFTPLLVLFSGFLFALALIRIGAAGQSVSALTRIGSAFILAVTTLASGLIAKVLLLKLEPLLPLLRERRRLRRLIKKFMNRFSKAERAVTAREQAAARWERKTKTFRAAYDLIFDRTRTEIERRRESLTLERRMP